MRIPGSGVITQLSTQRIMYRTKVPSYQIRTGISAVTWAEMLASSCLVHSSLQMELYATLNYNLNNVY